MEDNGHYFYFSISYAIVRLTSVLKRPFSLLLLLCSKTQGGQVFFRQSRQSERKKSCFQSATYTFQMQKASHEVATKGRRKKRRDVIFSKNAPRFTPPFIIFSTKK